MTVRRWLVLIAVVSVALAQHVAMVQRRWLTQLQAAQAAYENAKLTREIAEMAVVEFTLWVARSRGQEPDGGSDVDQPAWAGRMLEDYVPRTPTLDAMIRSLKAELARARADEAAKKTTYERVKAPGWLLPW
jgi:hypothetical protein